MLETTQADPQALVLGLEMLAHIIASAATAVTDADALTVLGALGFILGVGGSAMLMIKNNRWAHYGWAMYLGSNACWICYSIMSSQGILLAQNLCFSITSLIGVWTWIVRPKLQSLQSDKADIAPNKVAKLA